MGDVAVGRRLGDPAKRRFQLVEAVVILPCRQIQNTVLRDQGLDHRATGSCAPSGTAHHLGQHIEGRLRRPVAVGVETQIRIQNANQCHIGQIQALCHHLGADEDGDFFIFKAVQELFMGVHGTDRVRVHADDLRIRELEFQGLLDLLGANAQGLQWAAAVGAPLDHPLGMAAVVAHEPGIGRVEGQPVGAPGTLRAFPAVHADQGPGIAPAVEEQDGLVPPLEIVPHGVQQEIRKGRIVAVFQLLAHVHDLDSGELSSAEAAAELVESVVAFFRPVHGLDTGGGGAQEHQGVFLVAAPDGHLFGGVSGGLLGAVGMLLLLVQDDESKVLTGGEDRRAGANGDLGIAVFQPLPLVRPLARAQGAVEQCHLVPEIGRQDAQKLRRQGDLRNQEHSTSPLLQDVFDELQVDRGLAGAGDTVKKCHAGLFLIGLIPQAVKGGLLLLVQDQGAIQLRRDDLPAAEHGPIAQGQVAQGFQTLHGLGGCAGIVADILHRRAADAAKQLQHRLLHGRALGAAGGEGQGFLRRRGQGRDPLRLIAGSAQEVRFRCDPFFIQQVFQGLVPAVLVGQMDLQLLGIRRAA